MPVALPPLIKNLQNPNFKDFLKKILKVIKMRGTVRELERLKASPQKSAVNYVFKKLFFVHKRASFLH